MWISRSSWCIFNLEESLIFLSFEHFWESNMEIDFRHCRDSYSTAGRKTCFFDIELEHLGWSQKDHCLWKVVCRLGCIIANPHGLCKSAPRMLSHMFQDNFFFLFLPGYVLSRDPDMIWHWLFLFWIKIVRSSCPSLNLGHPELIPWDIPRIPTYQPPKNRFPVGFWAELRLPDQASSGHKRMKSRNFG